VALKKAIEKSIDGFPGKLIVQDAYLRVDKIEGNKTVMSCVVNAYSENVIIDTKQHSFVIDVNGENFIKQAYLHLKTLPEFADAEDC